MSNGQSVLPAVHPLHPWGWGCKGTLKQQRWQPDPITISAICRLSGQDSCDHTKRHSPPLRPYNAHDVPFDTLYWGGGSYHVN